MKRILQISSLSFLVVLAIGGISFAFFRTEPSPTAEERKQMDVLTGRKFLFRDTYDETYARYSYKTIEVKKYRTLEAFDRQHEAVPYLRLVSHLFERYNWPKENPVSVDVLPLGVSVTWPLSPEIERTGGNNGWPYLHQAIVYTNDMKIEVYPDDYEAELERRGIPREKWY